MEILRREIKLKGMTIKEVAAELDVSETAMYLWMAGKFLPRAVSVKKMLDMGFSEEAVISPSKEV